MFSGRKLPFLSKLPDIDFYDGKRYNTIELVERIKSDCVEYTANYFESLMTVGVSDKKEKTTRLDIQEELEARFDELFGSENNSDEGQSDV